MTYDKVQKSSSWNPQTPATTSRFAPPSFKVQAQPAPQPPTQQEIETEAFEDKQEAPEVGLQAKQDTITPEAQRLTELQASMDTFSQHPSSPKRLSRNLLEIPNLFAPREPVALPRIQPISANQIAAKVISITNPVNPQPVQREIAPEEEEQQQEQVQMKPSLQLMTESGDLHANSDIESRLNSSKGGGSPLPDQVRSFMEPRFGADFSSVRVHTNSEAVQMNRELGSQAFAHGSDIYYGAGKSPAVSELTAHELTHVVQQTGAKQPPRQLDDSSTHDLSASQLNKLDPLTIQNKSQNVTLISNLQQSVIQKNDDDKGESHYSFTVTPTKVMTKDEFITFIYMQIYGIPKPEPLGKWENISDITSNQVNKPVKIVIATSLHHKRVDTSSPVYDIGRDEKGKRIGAEQRAKDIKKASAGNQKAIIAEADKRFWERTGDKTKRQLTSDPQDAELRDLWKDIHDEVLLEKENLALLPPEIKDLLGGEKNFQPKDSKQLLHIAEKLKQFGPEDFAVYKLLAIKATDKLDLFEKSVDIYLARKEELKQALEAQKKTSDTGTKEPTMQDAIDEKWQGLDESAIGKMSEDERYELARQKTSELTEAQLKFMQEHPGQTLKDFAKSATLMNTGETFSAIGKDLTEAANGDANTWARWAAGVGGGAKISGWLLAVAGILYVASWLTGVGELATIAAAAGILLGSTLTLSLAESELRVKAASQSKTPEEFKRNVELAAAARTNVVVGLALIVVAAVLHFTAKAFFPKTIQKISTSLKNFRERVRLKGSIYELKPEIIKEMGVRKAELAKATELAKQKALDAATELEGLTTEQFVEKLEKGEGGFLDQSKLPPEQKVNYRELLETPEGRTAIEGYKQKLVNALKTDVIAEIDKLAQEYTSKIDEFLKDIDAAKNHDDLNAAADKIESSLTEEHAKKFMKEEQENLTKKKIEESADEAHKEVIAAIKDAIVKRVKDRIAVQSDKFQLTYTEAQLEGIIKKGKELGLSDKVIEDLIYTGSRTAKAISAAELIQQMEHWTNVISKRGFPEKFADMAEFQQFSKDLLEGINKAGLPADDVRIQGSSLRKTSANDVDIAVFVDEATFDKLLVDRYHQKIALTEGGTKISLKGKSHAELLQLADDIKNNPGKYNAQARTFQNAIKNGIISSKSDIIKPLKDIRADIAQKYPNLNLEAISLLIKGGLFDVKPDLPVKSN